MEVISAKLQRISDYFLKGHERSVKAKKNIIGLLVFKGLNILINLAIVPLTLSYIDATRYGIWFTLSSILSWFFFFDIGLGNGLKNKFAEAIAKNDKDLAKTYVSTTYFIITVIVLLMFFVFLLVKPFLNWVVILNTPSEFREELDLLVLVVFGFFCIRFVLKLISTIITADQKPAISSFLNFSSSLLSLAIIYLLTIFTSGSLLYLGIALSASPVIVFSFANIIFFLTKYNEFVPSGRFVKLKYVKELMNLGVHFFIIQIAALILFSTDNVIIAQLYGPESVTPYNIAYKYFAVITMLFGIVLTPFWSAFTDAFTKNDFNWIRNVMKKLKYLWYFVVFVVFIMVLVSNQIYLFWIGDKVSIPFTLSIFMGIFVIITAWNYNYTNFINGVGKIRIQLYSSIFVGIINVPLSVFFAKYLDLNISGVILATCFCQLIGALWAPLQYHKIINNKAYGIWAK